MNSEITGMDGAAVVELFGYRSSDRCTTAERIAVEGSNGSKRDGGRLDVPQFADSRNERYEPWVRTLERLVGSGDEKRYRRTDSRATCHLTIPLGNRRHDHPVSGFPSEREEKRTDIQQEVAE